MWSTVEELEAVVGEQVRARRLRANRTVDDVAYEAGVAAKTVQNLERGRGSSLATLVRVLRALGAEDWLETLAPVEPVSPVAVVEASRSQRARQRGKSSRG